MIDPDYMDDIEMEHFSHDASSDCALTLADMCDDVAERESLPSECHDTHWLYAKRRKGRYRKPTKRSGKWLIFAPKDKIDDLWVTVSQLTEQGKLGDDSKVSTLLGNNGRDFVICVYTYDWQDEEDCLRIRKVLREAGIEKPLPYKADADTLAGRYAGCGGKPLSKYWE